MLALIIRKEILSHILSLRFGVTFVLFFLLIFASIYVTVDEYLLEQRRCDSRVRVYKQKLDEILAEKQDWGPHGRLDLLFGVEGKRDAVPVSALSWLGQGVQAVMPEGIKSKPWEFQTIDRGLTRNPLLGLLPTPDFLYVVNVVLSLLSILFMFDAVCGEKETGTLRLTLSNSVPRSTILLGKWIGGYVTLLVPFLIAMGSGIGYAWFHGALEGGSEAGARILLLMLLACLYIAVFFNLSLFISTTTHHSATSLLVCLLLWVVFILAIPNLAPVTAKILEPTPSLQQIEGEKRAIDVEIEKRIQRLTLTSGELSYGDKIDKAKEKLELEGKHRKGRWDSLYKDTCQNQMDLAQLFGRISPSPCWVYAAAALTNTGPDVYQRLMEATQRLTETFQKFNDDYWKAGPKPGEKNMPLIKAEQLPSLRLIYPTVQEVVKSSLFDVLLLIILNVVFFMLAFTFFLRYDVR
jgi:ABC-type transport system involved in multi-copper enzyme maturation permease subunit